VSPSSDGEFHVISSGALRGFIAMGPLERRVGAISSHEVARQALVGAVLGVEVLDQECKNANQRHNDCHWCLKPSTELLAYFDLMEIQLFVEIT
jgi:hypothetical protein